jgi:hypothetical protein
MKQHLALMVGMSTLAAQWAVAADPKPAENPYLRFHEKAKGAELQVGVITMENKKTGAKVDLFGAVHIGDKAYYEQLNRQFKKYNSVLYEMVKPAGVDPAKLPKGRPASGVSVMQKFMQRQLDLAYQLDVVDYGAKNFVHADMTAKQFKKAQAARGESMFTLMFRMMREEMAREKKGKRAADITATEFFRALLSPTRAVDLKYIFAKQFNEMDRLTAGLDGKNGSAILTDRNTVALKVLEKELKAGKKSLAIFYGAAHLPDLEKRMIEKMGFERKGARWMTAWDLPERK